MIKIIINGKTIEVKRGTTVFKAAEQAGFFIPTMCHNDDLEHFTSCMICVVKETSRNRIIPSCSVEAAEGMEIVTEDEEIKEARKMALELLLSEHVGDCEAPCQLTCPAHMDIPLMNRLLAEGKADEALKVVRRDIALPSVLGRICPAPCEKACRRKTIDSSVSICLLKRFAGDAGIMQEEMPLLPETGKRVVVIGSGPAGLAAAYYLRRKGHEIVIMDRNEKPGGALFYSISGEDLDKTVLEREIHFIQDTGVQFRMNTTILSGDFQKLVAEYDAVVVATGDMDQELAGWGMACSGKQLTVGKNTYQTSISKVFAAGNVTRSSRLAVRSVGQGKEVAFSVDQFLAGMEVTGEIKKFNSKFGKLMPEEFPEYLKESASEEAQHPEKPGEGFSPEQAQQEAARCLHCDCRKPDDCKLRNFAGRYQAVQKRFVYHDRKPVKKYDQHDAIVYEPEKCIKCGICVRIATKYQEKLGLTFIGRGFDVKIGVPFNKELGKSLTTTARMAAEACPTGALSLKNPERI